MSGAGAAPTTTVRVIIARSEPAARRAFDVDRRGAHVILDLITAAARQDASLFYRYSCRSGFCGTCTVQVDGRPVLACQARVPPRSTSVHIDPLGGFPVVRDLVVDPAPFAERWAAIEPGIRPPPETSSSVRDADPSRGPRPIHPTGRRWIDDSLDCISCGACYAACDLSAEDRPFLGPAALTRAMVGVADHRDEARRARFLGVIGRAGVDGCHGIGACSLACPKGLDPARAIRRLRRWRVVGLP